MLGSEGVGTRIVHLKEKETFGIIKKRLDMSIGDASDSRRPNKVNFFQPYIRTKFDIASSLALYDKSKEPTRNTSKHVPIAFESDYNTSK